MKLLTSTLRIITVAFALIVAMPSSANDTCTKKDAIEKVEIVITAIHYAEYYGSGGRKKQTGDANESNLENKALAAIQKLYEYKWGDAIYKLEDISDKATAWADAPKPKMDDATEINRAVGDAIYCIMEL